MDQNTVAAGEAEFDPARERTTLVNALADAARAALDFDFMSAAVLGAIPGTEPQQYVIAGTPDGISKMLQAVAAPSPVSEAQAEQIPRPANWPIQSFDALDWARSFMSTFAHRRDEVDEALMLTWFSCALMRGFDEHAWQTTAKEAEQASAQAEPATQALALVNLLQRWASWIVRERPETLMDHACARCVPHGDMLVDGFSCVYHEALDMVGGLVPLAASTAPTDISVRLRAIANPGGAFDCRHVSSALLIQAADEIERYYGGMLNWKRTAEEKDASAQAAAVEVRDALEQAESALASCYNVTDFPGDGSSEQDAALAAVRTALKIGAVGTGEQA